MENRFAAARRRYLHTQKRHLHGDVADVDIGAASCRAWRVGAGHDRIVEQMKKAEGITEQLKATDQMEWVGRMNNIRQPA